MKTNKPELKTFRRHLRNNSTSAEIELWRHLKGKQVANFKFRRQHSIDNYILDFYCPQLKLGIELDGEYHAMSEKYDSIREGVLKQNGITILRYENRMVFEHLDTILMDVVAFAKSKKDY
ncbi:endonuclease domain-containing protein [Carboxylicivirga sp. M1479]|uniref:endonuclease domain-containing protein n=1 Tax=Carboxylicivirga sp. M1479 TaxID=2594476 RepID=UPI001177E634|nr:DUF559 domain-containing protein [Carboxylicivirga sp. M1479]TRX72477.1 DUF559 domain-containing protein [Carboxylicivirga sp. M1479]